MKYDEGFKRQTVRKVLDGQSVRSVSRAIGVTENQIHKWRREALKNGDGDKSGQELTDTQALKKGFGNWR